jgi:hypothetical protein
VVTLISEHLFSTSVGPIDDLIATNLACFLLVFRESYSGFFKVLHSKILKLLEKLTPSVLLSIVGFDFLYLYDDKPPIEFLRNAPFEFVLYFRAEPMASILSLRHRPITIHEISALLIPPSLPKLISSIAFPKMSSNF